MRKHKRIIILNLASESGGGGKTIVFGILERQKVYTEIVPDAAKKPLQAVIRAR